MKRSLLICLASVAMVVFITLALAVRVTTSATTVTESKQEFPIHYSDEADYMALMARCAQDGTQEASCRRSLINRHPAFYSLIRSFR